jgi:hypothetical protein
VKKGSVNFHEICYWGVLLKFVSTFQFWLKLDMSDRHFTWLGGESPGYLCYHGLVTMMVTWEIPSHPGKSDVTPIAEIKDQILVNVLELYICLHFLSC